MCCGNDHALETLRFKANQPPLPLNDHRYQPIPPPNSFDLDGYNLARRLERAGWGDVDAALVDVLEYGAVCISRARRSAIAAWVQREGITPAFEVGAKVTSPRKRDGGVGIIAKVDAAHAEYVVRFPLLGHVENGVGIHGSCLAFEDVEAA